MPVLTVAPTSRPSMSRGCLFESDLNALGHRRRDLAGGVVEHRDEFIAAPAAHRSGSADMRLGDVGENLQRAVADGMAVAVVDRS